VLSEQLHGARLRSFLAHLLGEDDVRSHGKPAERAVEHAVAMKIDFVTIGRLQESKFAGSIEVLHGSHRVTFVLFHLSLQTANMILDDGEHDDIYYKRWEWRLLNRGGDVVEQELDKAIHARGVHNIEVQVGGDTAYQTSIAFKVTGSNRKKQGPPPELSLLFSSLPLAGTPWSAAQRKRWFETAERMFDLMYGPAP